MRRARLVESLEERCFLTVAPSISGLVWNDVNANGIQDPGEAGVAAAAVELFSSVDQTIGNSDDVSRGVAITDATGRYQFDSLALDTPYYLAFRTPVGFVFTAQDQGGNDATDSDSGATGRTALITLAVGAEQAVADAGLTGATPGFGFALGVGSTGSDTGRGVATDAAGNTYEVGSFQRTVDFDRGPGTYNLTSAGSDDVFVAKYTSGGALVWAQRFGGTGSDVGYDVAIGPDGSVYTTGTFLGTADFDPGAGSYTLVNSSSYDSDIFVSKLDVDGNFVWAGRIGGANVDIVHGIAVAADGSVFVAGSFQGTADFDPGLGTFNLVSNSPYSWYSDAFVAKLDAAGQFAWARRMGGTDDDAASDIAVGPDGSVYTTGFFEGTVDFDPGPATYNLTSRTSYYSDVFISKLDAAGNFVWARAFGGDYPDQGAAIAVGSDGSVYTTGGFQDIVDFDPGVGVSSLMSTGSYSSYNVFVSKLDQSGNFLWARAMGGASAAIGNSLALAEDGSVYTTGSFYGTADFDPGLETCNLTAVGSNNDVFVSKLDRAGTFAWARRVGGAGSDVGSAVAIGSQGSAVVAGTFSGVVDFDPRRSTFPLTAAGSDSFLWSIAAPDAPLEVRLASNEVAENQIPGAMVGQLLAVSPDPDDGFTFQLAHGPGDWDNHFFTVGGDGVLRTTAVFDYETQNHYQVRVRATNDAGLWTEAALTVVVSDVEDSLTVGDRVWQDLNADGIQEAGEPGISGAFIQAFLTPDGTIGNSDDFPISSTTSAEDGSFLLSGLSESTNYYLVVHAPAGASALSFSPQAIGQDAAADSDVDATGRSAIFQLPPGEHRMELDIGLAGDVPAFGFALGLGASGTDTGYGVATDAAGNTYEVGSFQGTVDFDRGPGTYNLISAGGVDIFVAKYTSGGALVWARQFGGANDDVGRGITVGADGSVYTTGNFQGSADFDPGPAVFQLSGSATYYSDVFACKLDAAGNFVWADRFGGSNDDTGHGIAIAGDGSVYINGDFEGTADFDPGPGTCNLVSSSSYGLDAFVAKLDAAGQLEWARAMSGTYSDTAAAIALGPDGSVYTIGAFAGTTDFDPGAGTYALNSRTSYYSDVFVSKLDAAGDFAWARAFGGSDSSVGLGIAVASDGNVYTTGAFKGSTDFDPGAGKYSLTSASSSNPDVFVSKLDANGGFVWARRLGGTGADYGYSIALGGDGTVYTTGKFSASGDFDPGTASFTLASGGDTDIFVSELDPAGNFLSARQGGGVGSDVAYGIAAVTTGRVRIVGSYQGPADFDPTSSRAEFASTLGQDAWSSQLDADGELLSAASLGGIGPDAIRQIAMGPDGSTYSVGSFWGTVDFDPGPGIYTRTSTFALGFIRKLDKDGNFVWAVPINSFLANRLAVDADGSFCTIGYTYSGIDADPGPGTFTVNTDGVLVSKYDFRGNFLWARSFGSIDYQSSYDISIAADGSIYATGSFSRSADFDPGSGTRTLTSAGSSDVFITKFDPVGNLAWARAFGGPSNDRGRAVVTAADGSVYLTGTFAGTATCTAGSGTASLTSAGGDDIFVARLDSAGNLAWARAVGGSLSERVDAIAAATDGSLYLTGAFSGTTDFDPGTATFTLSSNGGSQDAFVCKLDASGQFLWAAGQGSAGSDEGAALAASPDGGVYSTGFFSGTADFDPGPNQLNLSSAGAEDVFVTRFDALGNLLWARTFGGAASDVANTISVAVDGSVSLGGSFNDTVDFDPGVSTYPMSSTSTIDALLWSLLPPDGSTHLQLAEPRLTENQPAGAVVGTLTTYDSDPTGTFTYALVTGPGDTDNAAFTIDGDGTLRTTASLDYEAKASYSVRVRTTDAGGLSSERAFTVSLVDLNEPPSLSLTNTITTLVEHSSTATPVKIADIVVVDDQLGTNVVSLSGADAAMFEIVGNSIYLKAGTVLDFEAAPLLDLIVTVDDTSIGDGPEVTQPLTISLIDMIETGPTDLTLLPADVAENSAIGTVIGKFSTAAPDGDDRFTYTMAAGPGSADNAAFTIDAAGNLLTATGVDYETQPIYSILVRVTDGGGLWLEKPFSITVTDVNEAATDLALSAATIAENLPPVSIVGQLTAIDPEGSSGTVYTLAEGPGSTDNGLFSIDGKGNLSLRLSADYENRPTYSVRVRATDDGGLSFEKAFTVSVSNVNEAPSELTLSSAGVAENRPVGTVVGTFAGVDPDQGDQLVYTLVDGEGAADNAAFTVDASGNLHTGVDLDYETKASYLIRVRATDAGGLSTERSFTIIVSNVAEAPTDVSLMGTAIAENQPAGTIVGALNTLDPDTGDTFHYSLVPGEGDADNAAFTVDTAGNLASATSFDYEARSTYSIRVRTTDSAGLSFEKPFLLTVTNVNEAPSDVALAPATIAENQPAGTIIGRLSTLDPDAGDRFGYSLIPGQGDSDNGDFTIDQAGNLVALRTFDYEARSTYSVRVCSTDLAGLWIEKALTVKVTNVAEPVGDLPGLYVPGNSAFYLRNDLSAGDAQEMFVYGVAGKGWIELVGDWNGDGVDTPGMYDPATSTFYLSNRLAGGDADYVFNFGVGAQGWKPLVGDWDGDGRDGVGLYEPATSLFFFKNAFAAGDADEAVQFGVGSLGWQPIVGDWDGLPSDGFGFYEPATSLFFLKNAHTSGPAEEAFQFGMGSLGWVPLAGNWDGTPGDGVGFYVPDTGQFFLKNAHTPGPADTSFVYGMGGQGWRPLVGSWVDSGGRPSQAAMESFPVTGDQLQAEDSRFNVQGSGVLAAGPIKALPVPASPTLDSPLPTPSSVAAATDQLDLAALASQELGSSLWGDDLDLLSAGLNRLRPGIGVRR